MHAVISYSEKSWQTTANFAKIRHKKFRGLREISFFVLLVGKESRVIGKFPFPFITE